MRHGRVILILLAVLSSTSSTSAADWPQYRADARRSGFTHDKLSPDLVPAWIRKTSTPPQRAWVGRHMALSRLHFDWSFATVVADGFCYFGSSTDDKVHALDAATGHEVWSFTTEGPVRLAPAVHDGRVYAGSDDGHLYCLDGKTGKLVWKLRAGPSDEKVIGNSRMVSRWVVRGGPAVRDGIVYFGAGIWPIEGVFVYAVDAKTGNILWCNDNTGALEIDQPHMVCFSRGGVASQGYLAVTKDHVLVTTGRSVPAVFDRATGDFIHFHLSRYGGKTPWGTGGGDVVATDSTFFNAGMAFDVATGLKYHPIGRRFWWDPILRDGRRLHGEFNWGDRQVINIVPGGFVRSEGAQVYGAIAARKTYDVKRELATARATARLEMVEEISGKSISERIPDAPMVKDEWSAEVESQPESLIVADRSIVVGMQGRVAILDVASHEQTWSAEVDGMVHSLAAAEGRLYASTDTGSIYCFADAAQVGPQGTRRWTVSSPMDSVLFPPADPVAEEILERTGVTRGYCLDLDCGDGSLMESLVRKSDLHVVGLARDEKTAAEARETLMQTGYYGTRASVLVATVDDLPDYFANLIVSGRSITDGVEELPEGVARVQRPCGGTICVGLPGEMRVSVREELEGAGQWTHNFGDAGNTMNSGDAVVKGPLGMLWYEDETIQTIDRHGKNPAPLAYRGLVLREGIDEIKCTDAYNGSLRWTIELPGVLAAYREGTQIGGGQIGSTYCVANDRLYVRVDNHCFVYDVFTGEKLNQFTAPTMPNGTIERWGYLAVKDGVLHGALMNPDYVIKSQHGDGGASHQSDMDEHFTESSLLFALDATTGKLKWTFTPANSIRNTALAVGDGQVYLIDREPAEIDKMLKDQFKKDRRALEETGLSHPTGVLVALDADSGEVVWQRDDNVFGTTLAVSAEHDVLLMAYNHLGFSRPSDWSSGMRAYRATDGETMWESAFSASRPAIVGDTIYSFPMSWNLLTGKIREIEEPQPGRQVGDRWKIEGKGQGCGLVAASENMLMLRSGALGYYDLTYDCGWLENYGGLRSGCFLNALPVAGIVVAPDDTLACRCSYQNQASIGLKEYGVRAPEINPTPGQKNVKFGSHAKEPAFTDTLVVEITHQRDDIEIRYTLDDTWPTADSPLYAGPFTIEETTPVRATAFRDGKKLAVRDVVLFEKVEDLKAVQSR